MTAAVVVFPRARCNEASGEHPASLLVKRLAAQLAGEDPICCADALTRLLASIACVNAINLTEAVETAQAMATDLDWLVRELMKERA